MAQTEELPSWRSRLGWSVQRGRCA